MPRFSFRSKNRRFGRLIVFSAIVLVFFPQSARAATYEVTGAQDFYFYWGEGQTVTVRTYAWQYGIDSMLWLYDSDGNLLAANDDYFGLDSYLQFQAQANTVYRIRAGVCCGDPSRWYGMSYQLETNVEVAPEPPPVTTVPETSTTVQETTTTSSTTVPETTTTVPETTTTVPETTTTTQVVPTTEIPTTTEAPQTTTTALAPPVTVITVTTLPDVPETVVSTTLPVVGTTTLPEPATTLPLPTTTSSTTTSSTSTVPRIPTTIPSTVAPTTTQPRVVAPTTTTPSEPDNQSDQVGEKDSTPAEILSQVPVENLEQFFEVLDMSALSPEEKSAFVAELSAAPDNVKKEFENTVNIYSGEFDEYVPVGSVINVGQRKVLIAATGVLFVAPSISTSSTSGSTQSSENRRGRK